ncbi:putative mitochondrial hypothetical protein [Leptomonas pyrrhocoris]|uniref:Uncharacterized protein n=1 Tax=Leptomonas pyrrhocoris TaxID=157538 RepID=A0A0M9G6B3_LEPPY|nr:putative mitochondrial hypothetical protein [Leptomonas pyrrhocoris]KPA83303.1 putative mitochondrial hypothetical protein [Leptomonas pyrrhocoris]|eukprot:XP_015661742.1 putative mitochondrial hypothetical protein [Leptomonas pyrrhocoris]
MEPHNTSTMMGGLNHMGPNSSSAQFLPKISSSLETIRLTYGALLRLCLHSTAYYGSRGFLEERVFGRKGAMAVSEREAMRYVLSMSAEIGVSVLIMPVRYLAASTTPRFMLDYMFTRWSDLLAVVDRFSPGAYASYALYAFASSGAEWNFDFFTWQVPSVILTLGKLFLRRRRTGAARCRTKRVMGVLLAQILLRAYMSTFSVMIPEQGSEAIEAMVVTVLEGMATSYLGRHTWPFPWEELKPSSSSNTTDSSTAMASEVTDTPPRVASGSGSQKSDELD